MSPESEKPFSDRPAYSHHPARIPLEGTDNFRDLGGYEAAGGRRVRTGLVFRSGHLGKLTDSDLARLEELKIRQVVDFRGPIEKEQQANRLPAGVIYVEKPVDVAGTDIQAEFRAFLKGEVRKKLETYLVDVNRQFVQEYSGVFAEWIRDIARNPKAVPQVFHCTAGKDRTGFASAIFLRVLGVSRETVLADYMLSGELMADSIDRIVNRVKKKYPIPGLGRKIRPLLGVNESFLGTAFDTINDEWGNFDTFVRDALGLGEADIAELTDRFLD